MDYIVNGLSLLTTNIVKFFSMCRYFFQSVIDFTSGLGSILSTLRFGVKTLLSGIWSSIVFIFEGSLFDYLYSAFNSISYYIGFHGALFISGLLFISMVRICIAFVFKLFRLNIDYHTLNNKFTKLNQKKK